MGGTPILKHTAFRAATVAATVILAASCGRRGPDGGTWLIRLDDKTFTVAQAGTAWTELSAAEKQFFLSRGNQVGEFIVSLSRKAMIQSEIERLGYMDLPGIVGLGAAWTRRVGFSVASDYIDALALSTVTDEDVAFFLDHIEKDVWYSLYPGTAAEERFGPNLLPLLDRELAIHLDSMQTGEVLPLADGTPVRLDSVFVTDPGLVAESLQDTTRMVSFATDRLQSIRSSRMIQAITDSVLAAAAPVILPGAFHRLLSAYTGGEALVPGDTLVVSGLGVLTTFDAAFEIEFRSTQTPISPGDSVWTDWMLHRMLYVEALLSWMSSISPEAMDSIGSMCRTWMTATAAESLYRDEVSLRVQVTPEMVREEYDNLLELPVVPERRSIQCVWIPGDMVAGYRMARHQGNAADYVRDMVFWDFLSEDDPPTNITRPLFSEEVPGGYGDSVFALGREDTTVWSDALSLTEDYSFFAFRLVRVYPAHEASFEEARSDLEAVVRARLEEDRTNAWLMELEERYHLEINEDILSGLPADPALWADL